MTFSQPSARTLTIIVALLVLCALAFAIPSCLQKQRSAAAQNRIDKAQGTATVESAREAGQVQASVNANEVASEQLGRDNEKEIRNAEGANAVVAAPVRNATIASLCKRAAYRDTERCRLLNAR